MTEPVAGGPAEGPAARETSGERPDSGAWGAATDPVDAPARQSRSGASSPAATDPVDAPARQSKSVGSSPAARQAAAGDARTAAVQPAGKAADARTAAGSITDAPAAAGPVTDAPAATGRQPEADLVRPEPRRGDTGRRVEPYRSQPRRGDPPDLLAGVQRWLIRSGAKSVRREIEGQVRRTLGSGRAETGDIWGVATTEPPPDLTEAPECAWCPICRAARRMRDSNPGLGSQMASVSEAVATAVQDAVGVVDGVLSRTAAAPSREQPADRSPSGPAAADSAKREAERAADEPGDRG
jgi:hypothetical protein